MLCMGKSSHLFSPELTCFLCLAITEKESAEEKGKKLLMTFLSAENPASIIELWVMTEVLRKRTITHDTETKT